MKKILVSVMIIALVVGITGVGFAAYFSDTETSSGNAFTAGTLDLQVDNDPGGEEWEVLWQDSVPVMTEVWTDFGNMAPGFYADPSVGIRNVGSVAGVPGISFENMTEIAGDDASADLAENVDVKVYYGENWPTDKTTNLVASGTLAAWNVAGKQQATGFDLVDDGEGYFFMEFSIATDVGNEIQGDSLSGLDIVLHLDQVQ